MCSYHLALRNIIGIAMSDKEEETVRELVLRNGGAATSPPLNNLRMSSSVNFSTCDSHPSYYCIGMKNVGMGQVSAGQRLKETCIMFEEGV
jgi:hypothetical protein